MDHKVKPGIEARVEKLNLAEITYSCLDDQHTPQFLSRLRNIATELTVSFEWTTSQKYCTVYLIVASVWAASSQLEFFYFENDDKEEDILFCTWPVFCIGTRSLSKESSVGNLDSGSSNKPTCRYSALTKRRHINRYRVLSCS